MEIINKFSEIADEYKIHVHGPVNHRQEIAKKVIEKLEDLEENGPL